MRKDGSRSVSLSDEASLKSDVMIQMTNELFVKLNNKEINGLQAYMSGKFKMNGSLKTLNDFDNNVVQKYMAKTPIPAENVEQHLVAFDNLC